MNGGDSRPSRRDVLRGVVHLALFVGGTVACSKASVPDSCVDVTGLTPDETRARTTLDYAEPAPTTNKGCVACQQYVAAVADGGCGSCKVLKGPVHPNGTCKLFAPKST